MKEVDLFKKFWSEFGGEPLAIREKYVASLPQDDRNELIKSFYQHGWRDIFLQNKIDQTLDLIKSEYNIDLIDMRIQAIKHNKVFLIEKQTWEQVENLICEFETHIDAIFGGFLISEWGKKKQFVKIRMSPKRR